MLAPKLNQNVIGVHDTLENLLQWSRTQMKGLNYSPISINVKLLMANCVALFSEAALSKKIALENLVNEDVFLFADENQIKLILRNLVNNAIKFTPEGGTVTLSAKQEQAKIELMVTDTGIGISDHELDTLLKANTHFSKLGTQGEKGTGLGLILCKEMAELNGGKINVTSQVGKGSTFTLVLPSKN